MVGAVVGEGTTVGRRSPARSPEHDRDGVHDTEVLVVYCDLEEKELLLDNAGVVLFSTSHYAGYPAMLVRPADVDLGLLDEVLEDSYRAKAPKRLLRLVDGDSTAWHTRWRRWPSVGRHLRRPPRPRCRPLLRWDGGSRSSRQERPAERRAATTAAYFGENVEQDRRPSWTAPTERHPLPS